MKLGEWLKQQKMSQEAFAELIKSDQGHVSGLVLGKIRPKIATIELISRITDSGVQYADWIPKPFKKKGPEPRRGSFKALATIEARKK